MSCQYGHDDCTNCNQCHLCFEGSKYKPAKKKSAGLQKNFNKQTKRKGAISENIAQKTNQATIDNICSSRLTVNSGAGQEKGDAWITGIIEIAQEVKTQLATRAKGCKSFSIQKEWLEKLERESLEANKEFWYLLFSFKEDDLNQYVVIDNKVMQDMIATMIHDRKVAKEANSKINLANQQRRVSDTKNTELNATIDHLQAKIEFLENLLKINNIEVK